MVSILLNFAVKCVGYRHVVVDNDEHGYVTRVKYSATTNKGIIVAKN